MKAINRNQAFFIWGVLVFSVLALQIMSFIDDYHSEIDKQQRVNYLNAKNIANEMENIIESEVVRIRQVSKLISLRLLDFIEVDHQNNSSQPLIVEQHAQAHKAHSTQDNVSHEHVSHQKALDWLVDTNQYLSKNFDISIKYVVEDKHEPMYLQDTSNIELARYKTWLNNHHSSFDWQFTADKLNNHLNFYAINTVTDKQNHAFSVIIEFNEKIAPSPIFDSLHYFYLINKESVVFKIGEDQIEPVTISLPQEVGFNVDTNYINQQYGVLPTEVEEFNYVERFGKQLIQRKGATDIDYFFNSFYFEDIEWRFVVLSDAALLIEGIEGEFDELFEKILVVVFIAVALAFIIYYHYKVASLLQHDALTKLLNRNHFKTKSEELTLQQERNNEFNIGIIAIDIDKFKRINDTFGHAIGDEVLLHLSKLMTKGTRKVDFVYRFGGEEFLILCPGDNAKNTQIVAERLRISVEQDQEILSKVPEGYTISLGVTEKQPAESIEDALKRADELLYTAKDNGRNQVQTSISDNL